MLPERAEVLIVGAGPAGLAAAIELRRLGVRDVVVADREPEAGGIPRLCHHTGFGLRDLRRVYSGPDYAAHYRHAAQRAGINVQTETTITGWRRDDPVGRLIADGEGDAPAARLYHTSPRGVGEVEARAVLLATGCRERPRAARLVPGTRPAGIFTTGSLQRFVYEQRLPVGQRAVIAGAELVSLSALLTLRHAGVRVVTMVTELPQHQIYFPYRPMKWLVADWLARVPIRTGARVAEIFGQRRVEGVAVTDLGSGQTETIACDCVIFTGDWIPEHELARLGGVGMDSGTRGPQVDGALRTSRRGVFAAGNLLRGAETADACALEGIRAAQHIRRYLNGEAWPETGVALVAELPLSWVCPNVVTPCRAGRGQLAAFIFRSHTFCDNVRVQVHQGDALLHSQGFRRLIVNESMPLANDWLKRVNPLGEPLRLSIASP